MAISLNQIESYSNYFETNLFYLGLLGGAFIIVVMVFWQKTLPLSFAEKQFSMHDQ